VTYLFGRAFSVAGLQKFRKWETDIPHRHNKKAISSFSILLNCTKLLRMTRTELLRALIRQAKANGFEFRKWYSTYLGLPWTNFESAVQSLAANRHYYALLFAHDFAQSFWREGTKMTFVVPTNRFTRVSKNGSPMVVERKGHTRRTVLPDAWRFHLKAMAVTEEPLRYIRKFLLIEEDLAGTPADMEPEPGPEEAVREKPVYKPINENDSEEELHDSL
jgi:hypothetical protein